jgi:Uma2 family endonuclease
MVLRYTTIMSHAIQIRRYTLAEYLAMEPEGDVRHEFVDGEIFAMVGASRVHNGLVMNLAAAIRPHLRGTPCRIASQDMKVLIAAANRSYYPDLVVSCSDPVDEIDDYTETHPRLIIEVLSPSTATTDRREKRLAYQTLDSLQDYVLVAQTEPLVEVYSRQPDGWTQTCYGANETVALPSIDLQLRMAVIFEDVPLAPTTRS